MLTSALGHRLVVAPEPAWLARPGLHEMALSVNTAEMHHHM
jgi:hypothetical protein